jgi:AraC family transcriptional regulator of adaptative response / DNA-3-methyladenine glycosylase II
MSREPRGAAQATGEAALALRLPAHPPFDAAPLLAFFAARAIPGVEEVLGGAYRRTALVGGAPAAIEVAARPGDAAVTLRLSPAPPGLLPPLLARATRLFDLDADVAAIAAQLAGDPRLRRAIPGAGVRVPGAWDPFELGVRALLGQQVSVAAAGTLAARLVRSCGAPLPAPVGPLTHLFPAPAAVAAAPLERLGLTRARAAALRAFAAAVADGTLDLDGLGGLDDAVARLAAMPGIGPWTAQVIALRALREPDAFPAGDLGVRRALAANGELPGEKEVLRRAERWRPWRAYAAVALWNEGAAAARPEEMP